MNYYTQHIVCVIAFFSHMCRLPPLNYVSPNLVSFFKHIMIIQASMCMWSPLPEVSVFLCWTMCCSRFWPIAAPSICLGNVYGMCEWITLSSPNRVISFSVLRPSVCISRSLRLPIISLPLPFFLLLLSPPYHIYFPNGTTVAGGAEGDTTQDFLLPCSFPPEKCLFACSFPMFSGRKSTMGHLPKYTF